MMVCWLPPKVLAWRSADRMTESSKPAQSHRDTPPFIGNDVRDYHRRRKDTSHLPIAHCDCSMNIWTGIMPGKVASKATQRSDTVVTCPCFALPSWSWWWISDAQVRMCVLRGMMGPLERSRSGESWCKSEGRVWEETFTLDIWDWNQRMLIFSVLIVFRERECYPWSLSSDCYSFWLMCFIQCSL